MRTARIGSVALVALVALCGLLPLASGCGSDDASPVAASPTVGRSATDGSGTATAPGAGDPAGIMLAGSGLMVAELLQSSAAAPLAVRAYVVVEADGSARLCDALAESFPPQCGGASIGVTGLVPELIDALPSEQGRRWSDGPVQLIGALENGVFVNDPLALAAS